MEVCCRANLHIDTVQLKNKESCCFVIKYATVILKNTQKKHIGKNSEKTFEDEWGILPLSDIKHTMKLK
jgi:hypothetical protein